MKLITGARIIFGMRPEEKKKEITSIVSTSKNINEILAEELGEKFLEYRKKWDEASECRVVQEFPIHLDMELNGTCNFACPSCVQSVKGYYGYGGRETIPFDRFREIIDEGVEYGLCSITFNGNNEPLLKEDLFDHIRYAKSKGVIDIFLLTNASLLDEKKTEEVLNSGVTRILFSLDAIREETYKIVRRGGNYRKVIDNILHFLKRKEESGKRLPITRASFVVNRINNAELDEFIRFWKDKVDCFAFQNFLNPFIGEERYGDTEKLFRVNGNRELSDFVCTQPFQRLFIRNTGDVLGCCTWYALDNVVGNIYREDIRGIWTGEKMRALRETVNGAVEFQSMACRKCRESAVERGAE